MLNVLFFATFSFISGSALFSFLSKNWYFLRFCVLYVLFYTVGLVIGNIFIVFILYIAVSLYVIKKEPNNILYYYIVMLSTFPVNADWVFGVPGINYLFVFNHARILIFLFFLTYFFKIVSSQRSLFDPVSTHSGLIDRAVFLYMLWEMLLHFRDYSATIAIRLSLHLFVDIWLPYFVISRTLRDLNTVLIILLFSAVVISVVAIVEATFFLRVYDLITLAMGDSVSFRAVRDGALRVYASMASPLTLGFFLSMSLILAFKVRKLMPCAIYVPWILTAIIILGISASGSRSPIATNIPAFLIILWWSLGSQFVRKTSLVVFCVFLAIFYWLFFSGVEFIVSFDDAGRDGTFYYRYELLLNSSEAIANNFLFGSKDFWLDAKLQNSMQGEGIIDITNMFLGVILNTGMIGLIFFVSIWLFCLRGLSMAENENVSASLLMGMCVNTMLMLFISSPVFSIPYYFWMLIALIAGFLRNNTYKNTYNTSELPKLAY